MAAHTCHADGCKTPVSRGLLMCARHWRMVPKPLQDAVWAAYTPGQEHNPDCIRSAYFDAAFAAIIHVRDLESGVLTETKDR